MSATQIAQLRLTSIRHECRATIRAGSTTEPPAAVTAKLSKKDKTDGRVFFSEENVALQGALRSKLHKSQHLQHELRLKEQRKYLQEHMLPSLPQADEQSRAQVEREIWLLTGVIDHDLAEEKLVQVAEKFARIHLVPRGYFYAEIYQGTAKPTFLTATRDGRLRWLQQQQL